MGLRAVGMVAVLLLSLSAANALCADGSQDLPPQIRQFHMQAQGPDFGKVENPDSNHWMPFLMMNWHGDDVVAGVIESRCEAYVTGKERTKNGVWVLHNFHAAFNFQFRSLSEEPERLQGEFAKVEAWIKAVPASKCAPLVLANLWLSTAWQARGRGYSTSVTPEGWRLFSERIRKANEVLDQHQHLNKLNPEWFALKVSVLGQLEGDHEQEILGWVGQSLVQFPSNYEAAETATLRYLPKWGGNWVRLDSYIESVAHLADGSEGDEVYSRLYWNMYTKRWIDVREDFRAGTRIDWLRFKRGLYNLMKRYPESQGIKNSIAAFACRAEDKDTYLRLRPLFRDDDATTMNDWAAMRLTPRVCDQKFGGIPG